MISLAQLAAELGPELRPGLDRAVTPRPLTGVHVSELEDPTPYLSGGELLLTTGMPFTADASRSEAYMARLSSHDVQALGLGLGPWLQHVPDHVLRASREHGVELVVVPDKVPFQNISRAFWRLAAREDQAGLLDVLGAQSALARAAMRPDAVAAVTRGLAQALGGWVAYLPAEGDQVKVWPPNATSMLPLLRTETLRFNRAGTHSAATFEINGQPVVTYPILADNRIHGFLGLGAGRRPGKADRQLISTVTTLLALKAKQREALAETSAALGAATAKLLLLGHTEAAKLLAHDIGLGALPPRVRLLAIRPGDAGTEADTENSPLETSAWTRLVPDQGLPDTSALSAAVLLRHVQDGIHYLVLNETAQEGAAVHAALSGVPAPGETGPDGALAAVLSEPLALHELAGTMALLRRAIRQAPAGRLSAVSASYDARAKGWVELLASYPRADLVGTVTSYLGHRGRWEDSARDLELHRNSLRHRISIAQARLGVDLDDPDVAAHLWLALRDARA